MTEEQKETYSAFASEISEILGLEKPVDVLKLCVVTDRFFRPLQNHIKRLQEENDQLIRQNELLKTLLRQCYQYHLHPEVLEYPYDKVKKFFNEEGLC